MTDNFCYEVFWFRASQEQAEQVLEELAGYHPSRMIPFIGDVKAPVAGLAPLLIGEFVFQDSNLGAVKLPCRKDWFLVGTGAGCLRDCASE